jgi:uncharacterized membrane protein
MPKKMKSEWSEEEMHAWKAKKKMWMGVCLLVLGLILYSKEVGIIPWAGSIWTLGAVIVGIVLLIKGALKGMM